jgi:hypothetical protein
MLVAVAAASSDTTSRLRTKISTNILVSIVSKYKTPAILALKRGDASAIRPVNTSVLMIVSPHEND